MASPVGISFLDHFAALRNPRQAWKIVFPLPEVLLVVLCGTLAGAGNLACYALTWVAYSARAPSVLTL